MKRRRHSSGSVLVELALVLPLAISLILGAVHFGYLFFLYNGLEKSVRDGARYAAGRTYTTYALYTDVVKKVVVYGSLGGTTPVVNALTQSMVVVTPIPNTAGVRPQRIRVTITGYTYTGVLSGLLGTTVLTNKPSMEIPFIGLYRPPS
ncbi:MAG: pilus assembly protein [Acidobacteria bacterium]|nr:pilus assembly protein [Acidobacteriota bacterium]